MCEHASLPDLVGRDSVIPIAAAVAPVPGLKEQELYSIDYTNIPVGRRGLARPTLSAAAVFGSDTAPGLADCALAPPGASVLAIVIYPQEVSPMNAVSAMGAPPQSTIARLS